MSVDRTINKGFSNFTNQAVEIVNVKIVKYENKPIKEKTGQNLAYFFS